MEWMVIQTLLEYFQQQKRHSILMPTHSIVRRFYMVKNIFKLLQKWVFILFLFIHLYSFICLFEEQKRKKFPLPKYCPLTIADSDSFL